MRRCIGGPIDHAQNMEDQTNKRDLRLTKISVIIVIVFAICHLPRFVPNLFEIFTNKNDNMPKVLIFVLVFSWFWYGKVLTFGSVVLVDDGLGLAS